MVKNILITALLSWSISLSAQSVRVLDLQQCIEIALENNLSVKRGALSLEGARIDKTLARGNQLPNLNLNGNYGYNWGRSIDPTTNQFINQQITRGGVSGSSNVVLFNGFRLLNSVKQSQVNIESSTFDLEKIKNDVTINIVTFYLNVIFNRELLENADFQLNSAQEQLERTKKLVASGALPLTNELELTSQVATNEVNLINAQNNLDLALLTLKQAMLLPASEPIEIIVPDITPDTRDGIGYSSQEVFDAAMTEMPEIQSAKLGLESAQLGIRIARATGMPSLNLGGSFSTNYSDAFSRSVLTGSTFVDQDIIFNGQPATISVEQPTFAREEVPFNTQIDQNLSRSLGISLSIPVFNRFSTYASVQRANIALQQAEITVKERENTLRQQIESAYNDAQAAAKTYEANQKQVNALEETFRAVENQYNLGAANFTDYQVASNNLFRAKSDFVRAKYDYVFKLKILEFYKGNPLTID